MASRSVSQYVADIARETRGQVPYLECLQALRDAVNLIDSRANWEFLITRTTIPVNAPYTTGTVAVASNGLTTTLTTGTWNPGGTYPWKYRSIKLASRLSPYDITSFSGSTTATLGSVLSDGTAVTADTYTIYQSRYPLPSDCEPGRDLMLSGPFGWGDGSGKIPKVEAAGFQRQDDPQFTAGAAYPSCYTDDSYDETNNVATIRLNPYPKASADLRLLYYKKMTVPASDAATIALPEAYERLAILVAGWPLKKRYDLKGWLEDKQEATNMMQDLFNRYAVSPAYEDAISPQWSDWGGPLAINSSLLDR